MTQDPSTNPIPPAYRQTIYAALGVIAFLASADAFYASITKKYEHELITVVSVFVGIVIPIVCISCVFLVNRSPTVPPNSRGKKSKSKQEDPLRIIADQIADEIRELRSRSVVNLITGITASATAFGIFVWYAQSGAYESTLRMLVEGESNDLRPFLAASMQLGLIVFIELFAFFFLRQYVIVQGEIRFYMNEITNINAWKLASNLASDPANESVVSMLMSIDRNEASQSNHMLKHHSRSEVAKLIRNLAKTQKPTTGK